MKKAKKTVQGQRVFVPFFIEPKRTFLRKRIDDKRSQNLFQLTLRLPCENLLQRALHDRLAFINLNMCYKKLLDIRNAVGILANESCAIYISASLYGATSIEETAG